tara:strand:+ start:1197 stop:1355 length:159 start_codon:yes stop_codon:yes gene_type:complete
MSLGEGEKRRREEGEKRRREEGEKGRREEGEKKSMLRVVDTCCHCKTREKYF